MGISDTSAAGVITDVAQLCPVTPIAALVNYPGAGISPRVSASAQ
jgi:hypothetical protein